MAHHTEIVPSVDHQFTVQIDQPPLNEATKDEIEERREVADLIEKGTNGQDPSGLQINKSVNQIFEEIFEYLDNSSIKSCTIFKVNVCLRESNPDAYTPKIVSIGPYHKKNPQLRQMEKYKLLCLRRFLQRKEGLDVESCLNELEELKERALKCYDLDTVELEKLEKDEQKCYDVKIDEFCQMLLLDGCFVIEFIRERFGICPRGEHIIISPYNLHIFRDLMLLENQLPFFILGKLHDMTKQANEPPLEILVGMPFAIFVSFIKTEECDKISQTEERDNIRHILHLVHILSCHGSRKRNLENNDGQCSWVSCFPLLCHAKCCRALKKSIVMPNATELSEAGVRFEKVDVITTLFDSIEFKKGVMKIPHFEVDDNTDILLRNLIAYEQQSVDVHPKHFSNFAIFMYHLIDSDKDVNLLRQKGIIVNRIGEDKGVTNLFNKIGNGVITYSDFYYKEEFTKACAHCEKPWNKLKANLKHNYFSTPWAGASTVAAIILLILTTIQTVLAFTCSIQ